jgi:SNF2-related domain
MHRHGVQVVTKLHSILKPFLLRRVKTDVESALPGKLELVLYAPMTPTQRRLNDQLLKTTLQVPHMPVLQAGDAPCMPYSLPGPPNWSVIPPMCNALQSVATCVGVLAAGQGRQQVQRHQPGRVAPQQHAHADAQGGSHCCFPNVLCALFLVVQA